MNRNYDILELKFEGNGINPKSVKASEIASLITEFECAILSTLKYENPEIDTKSTVLLCFESVEDKSIGIFLSSNIDKIKQEIKTLIGASYVSLATSIGNADFNKLPDEAILSLKKIQTFTTKNDCQATFKYNGETLSVINSNSKIKVSNNTIVQGDTTIYGELIDVGGENPNIHIRINDDYKITITTTKQQTKELANRLYETIGLKGNAKWDLSTSKITEFKLYNILEYTPGNIKKAFEELKDISNGFWDSLNSNDEINRKLLRD